jgi:hypothetical protein
MKLSEEAKMRADALLSKSTYEIAVWIEEDQRRVRLLRTQSNPQFNLMAQHYEERIRRAFKGLINAYIEGYRLDESLIDDEDKDEIINEIRSMIDSQHHHVTNSVVASRDFAHPYTGEKIPNMDEELHMRFQLLLGEAAIELNLARTQLIVEHRQRAREKSRGDSYQINMRDNYGNIQQGGENNGQTINPKDGG